MNWPILWSVIRAVYKSTVKLQFVVSPHSILPHSSTRPNEHNMIYHIWVLHSHRAVPLSHVIQDCLLLRQIRGLERKCLYSLCCWLMFEETLATSVANFRCAFLTVLFFVRHQKSKATVPWFESEKKINTLSSVSCYFYI